MGHTVASEYSCVGDSPLHQKVGVLDYFSLTIIKYSDMRKKDLFWLKVQGYSPSESCHVVFATEKQRAVNAMCLVHISCHIILSQTGSKRCCHPQDNPSQVCLVLACLLGDSRSCKLKIRMSHHSRDSVLEW